MNSMTEIHKERDMDILIKQTFRQILDTSVPAKDNLKTDDLRYKH